MPFGAVVSELYTQNLDYSAKLLNTSDTVYKGKAYNILDNQSLAKRIRPLSGRIAYVVASLGTTD